LKCKRHKRLWQLEEEEGRKRGGSGRGEEEEEEEKEKEEEEKKKNRILYPKNDTLIFYLKTVFKL